MNTYTRIHTDLRTYTYTYIHTYVHTRIHIHICTYIRHRALHEVECPKAIPCFSSHVAVFDTISNCNVSLRGPPPLTGAPGIYRALSGLTGRTPRVSGYHFGRQTARERAPSGPRSSQDGPKRFQDGPRALQDAQDGPQTAQKASKMPQEASQENLKRGKSLLL